MEDFILSEKVSRETKERLNLYVNELLLWQKNINLISNTSREIIFSRHVVDSLQIFPLIQQPVKHYLDIGSGGGFPGVILSILLDEAKIVENITLIESDSRKCAFLREVFRKLSIGARVINDRIERVGPQGADILTARALAPLCTLLDFSNIHLKSEGVAIFPKGMSYKDEIDISKKRWKFELTEVKSVTNASSALLVMKKISLLGT